MLCNGASVISGLAIETVEELCPDLSTFHLTYMIRRSGYTFGYQPKYWPAFWTSDMRREPLYVLALALRKVLSARDDPWWHQSYSTSLLCGCAEDAVLGNYSADQI